MDPLAFLHVHTIEILLQSILLGLIMTGNAHTLCKALIRELDTKKYRYDEDKPGDVAISVNSSLHLQLMYNPPFQNVQYTSHTVYIITVKYT